MLLEYLIRYSRPLSLISQHQFSTTLSRLGQPKAKVCITSSLTWTHSLRSKFSNCFKLLLAKSVTKLSAFTFLALFNFKSFSFFNWAMENMPFSSISSAKLIPNSSKFWHKSKWVKVLSVNDSPSRNRDFRLCFLSWIKIITDSSDKWVTWNSK